MRNKYLKLSAKYPDFALLTLGSLLSAVGISFTAIATYTQLEQLKVTPFIFSLAFILETAPGAIAARIADRHFRTLPLGRALVAAEFFGACLMILPILGILTGSLALLLMAGVIGSATVGFMIPFHKTHMRRILNDEEVSAATFLSNYVFAATFVLGTVGGTLLLSQVGPLKFYLIDTLTYLISCAFTLAAIRLRRENFLPLGENSREQKWTGLWNKMSPVQKKGFLLSTLLVVNCAPSTAILPSIALQHSAEWATWGIVLSPAMTLLILKTVGQLLGPMVMERFDIQKVIELKFAVPLCLLAYQIIYLFIFVSGNIAAIFPMVVVAHIFSNIVFMLGYYSMMKYFSESEIGTYSSFHHQLSIVVLVFSCVWSGWIATKFGALAVAQLSILVGAITSVGYLNFEKRRKGLSYESSN
jgi:MFS family permease